MLSCVGLLDEPALDCRQKPDQLWRNTVLLPVHLATPQSVAVGRHLILSLHLANGSQRIDVVHQTSSSQVQLVMHSHFHLGG